MRRIFGRGRYANVTATLALVVALGGTSYAAVTITGRNIKNGSIKRVDLGNNSVTSAKVRNGSLTSRDLRPGLLAGIKGPKGDKGDQGDPGPPGTVTSTTLPTQLSAGQTLRGYVHVSSAADLAGENATASVSFPFPLPSAPAPANVHFIASGAAVPAGCTGDASSPGAAPGTLCVFEATAGANTTGRTLSATRFGFTANATSVGPGAYGYVAHWAVTAA
jgi:hypothetical protein